MEGLRQVEMTTRYVFGIPTEHFKGALKERKKKISFLYIFSSLWTPLSYVTCFNGVLSYSSFSSVFPVKPLICFRGSTAVHP